jgi:flagellar capping protein FliD
LADNCLLQANAQLKKKAWVLPVLGAVAATLGAVYAHQHLPNSMQGLDRDYKSLDKSLQDVINGKVSYGRGHEYDTALKEDAQGLRDRIKEFMDTYNSLLDVMRQLEKPRDVPDLVRIAKEPATQEVIQAHDKLNELFVNISTYLSQVEENFTTDFYKSQHTKDTGVLTSLWESIHGSGGADALTADPLQTVANAIPTFNNSINQVLEILEKSKSFRDKALNSLSAANKKKQAPAPATTKPVAANPLFRQSPAQKPDQKVNELDNTIGDMPIFGK